MIYICDDILNHFYCEVCLSPSPIVLSCPAPTPEPLLLPKGLW